MHACISQSVRTTIALDPALRDKLTDLKRLWNLPKLEDVVRKLVEEPPLTAGSLFERRKPAVLAVIARYRVKRVIAFGSRANGEARSTSDLDLAVSIPKEASLFDLVHLQDDLTAAFGLPVHILEIEGIPAERRNRFLAGAVTLYP